LIVPDLTNVFESFLKTKFQTNQIQFLISAVPWQKIAPRALRLPFSHEKKVRGRSQRYIPGKKSLISETGGIALSEIAAKSVPPLYFSLALGERPASSAYEE